MEIPKFGMGTWGMGGKYEADLMSYEESIKIIKYGLDLGISLIDTAEIYGRGLTEKIIGEAIAGYQREKIYIISKVWIENLEYEAVIKSAEGSLKRMKTDYIDLYLIHWSKENISSKDVPLSETIEAMEYLAKKGVIKNIGVSNASVEMMEQVQRCLKSSPLAANQIEYNLFDRSVEKDIVPFCHSQGIKIIAYRPLAMGKIAEVNNSILEKLSKKYNHTPIQVALNWIISQNIIPIPKAGNIEHLKENVGALGWSLEKNDINIINNL